MMMKPANDFMDTELEMPGQNAPRGGQSSSAAAGPESRSKSSRSHDPVSESLARFADELRSGLRPRIENYLADVAPSVRETLFLALLRAELETQVDGDEPLFIFRGQYLDRFPDRKAAVARVFAELEASKATISHVDSSPAPSETIAATPEIPASLPWPVMEGVPSNFSLGRFELLRQLGEGTSGRVFLARDPKLDREVAIKIPHPSKLQSGHDVERFRRTARAAAQLRHENLCPIYEINDVPGNYFLVMAYIRGKPLSHYLDQHRRLPIRQAVLIARLLATAMIEPHQKGIVHRDLKPDNIQIDEDRRVPVIMDFGLAHFEMPSGPQLTHDGQLLGTPYYMSPEQAVGHLDEIGPLSDLYALGVILYEMLTGYRPITGRTMGEVLRNVHTQQPIPPQQHRPQVDSTLNDLCLKAIAKTPADRFASMTEFARVLANYLSYLKTQGEPRSR